MNPPPADPLLDALHRVAPYAVASGLTPLIPVPFLDDYALRRVRERLVRELLAEHHAGLAVDDATVRALAGHAVREGSRVQQFLGKAALLPLRFAWKVGHRRLLTALWVKDCVDMASLSLHHGYLLHHALARGDLPPSALATPDAARRVHAAILAACREVDTRPVNQALRRLLAGSRLVLDTLERTLDFWSEAWRGAWNGTPPTPPPPSDDDAAARASLAERLAALLWEQDGYFHVLEARYARHLAAA